MPTRYTEPPGTTSRATTKGSRYFTSKGQLKAIALTEDVRRSEDPILEGTSAERQPVIIKPFERNWDLYYWDPKGVWLPGGERLVRRRVAELLGDQYRSGHASTVVDVIQHGADTLPDLKQDGIINCGNGLLDWRGRRLLDHYPGCPSRIQIPTWYQPEARCPNFMAWLKQVVEDDGSIDLVFEMIGYCLLNSNPFHKAFMIYGQGRNGKSTLLRTITMLLGLENTCSVPPQALDADRFAAADLFDKLANLAGDVEAKMFMSTQNFKKATGGDMLRAERKFGQPFQFEATATTIASYNELPTTADTTDGFFNRFVVLPMTKGYFPAGKADPSIERAFQTPQELSGILNHAITSLQILMHRGSFKIPVSAARAKEEFELHAHPVRAFIVEFGLAAIEEASGAKRFTRKHVYTEYKTWAMESGLNSLAARRFYAEVEALKALPGFAVSPRVSGGERFLLFEPTGATSPPPAEAEAEVVQEGPEVVQEQDEDLW